MSSNLRTLVTHMRGDVSSAQHRRAFAEAQLENECLARYSSVADVLGVFAGKRDDDMDEIERVTRTLIVEHRRRTSALWVMLLVIAYHPMLSCLRHRARRSSLGSTELEQCVLCAFLETIEGAPVECGTSPIVLFLHRRTARALFKTLKREARAEFLLEQFEHEAPESLCPTSLEREQHSQLLFDDLCRRAGDDLNEADLRLIATFVLDGHESNRAVQGVDHSEPTSLVSERERIRRRRTRALEVLRKIISPKDSLFERSA
ncbi:MAG TPA: hypothetical protein VKP30_00385 [Polyangiaceae bacterium]|nr:hypothetical protein [Polyangiaceae bacterium]